MTQKFFIEVVLEDAGDNGLRVFSEQLPGLILSGTEKMSVTRCILPAIKALLEAKNFTNVTISQTMPFSLALAAPSPRVVDIDVNCSEESKTLYLVEYAEAA